MTGIFILDANDRQNNENYYLNEADELDELEKSLRNNDFCIYLKSIDELQYVKNKKNVYEINISNSDDLEIIDLDCLKEFTNLKILIIEKNENLTELSNLNNLKNLTKLIIQHNEKLTKLPNLDCLIKLEKLDISFNIIKELPFINTLVNLKGLNCSFNDLKKLPCIDKLTLLEKLCCEFNDITELPYLGNSHKLVELSCNNNNLTGFTCLDNLTNLEILNCNNNTELTQLPYLGNLRKLEYLTCYDTKIKSLPRSVIQCLKLRDEYNTGLHIYNIQHIYKNNNCNNNNESNDEYDFHYKENENLPYLVNWIIREKYYYNPIMTHTNNILLNIEND